MSAQLLEWPTMTKEFRQGQIVYGRWLAKPQDQAGQRRRDADYGLTSNPYPERSDEWKDWRKGWLDTEAAQLREWQVRRGLTQDAAAKVLGVGYTTYRHWVMGRHPIFPIAMKLIRYIDRFGLID